MKRFVLFILLVLLPTMVFCFDFAIGPKLGLNVGWMSGNDWEAMIDFFDDNGSSETAGLRIGFSGGIFLTLGLFDFLAIQPEILFSTVGGRYRYTEGGVDFDGVQSANVFEIPIFLKPRIRLGSGTLYLLIGPNIVFILGDIVMKEEAFGTKVEFEIEPDNSTIFGISGGLGYEIPTIFKRKISFEVKYTKTLTESSDDWEEFNNLVVFMVGCGFYL